MDPQGSAYHVCYASRIRSPLDLPAFRRAVQTLVDRHPGLRTTFEERDGVLLQRVHESPPLLLEVIDAFSWSEDQLRERLEDEAHRPFNLEQGPLVRMQLFRRALDDHIFLLEVHHIVGDFWSLVLVIEEMQALYPAECDGRPAALNPPARHYRDFVRWQAELLAGPEGERLWAYWEQQLAGAPTILDLPADRPRPPDSHVAAPQSLGAAGRAWHAGSRRWPWPRGPRCTPSCWPRSRCYLDCTLGRRISWSARPSPAGAAPDSRE
jgi:hypothetical protein